MPSNAPILHAYYGATVDTFAGSSVPEVVGALALGSEFAVEEAQRDAWADQIDILQSALRGVPGTVFFEYVVPRIGSRIDVVLISGAAVVVIEFKVGAEVYERSAENQVWDYALDLKNFHSGSHLAPIYPVLVATHAIHSDGKLSTPAPDGVYRPLRVNAAGLRSLLELILRAATGPALDPQMWARAPYRPTPTIIEAAQALYAHHSVDAISRNDAGAKNLSTTSSRVEELIEYARANGRRVIIFITGVPGAGKTLVGLNVATKQRDTTKPTHAVFLSGNGPLVKVLREALTRDEVRRLRARRERKTKGEVAQPIKAFIQNVHHFRDAGLRDDGPPADHVVIFDEAQRAWNHAMTASFMAQKKKRIGFTQSEPEFLISYLDRHPDWAVVACLVGGGQEINRGEAGISAWLDAVRERFPHWDVHISPKLIDSEYTAMHALERLTERAGVMYDERLHLAVSMRSFRAEHVSAFVKAVLDCEVARAAELRERITERYPMVITRHLDRAKQWVRDHARGSERVGMVASSAAHRLKPHAIDIRVQIDPVHWFLNGPDDTRASTYLEDAATEFQVQGLELDWVCVTWDADLRFAGGQWDCHSFKGSKWQRVRKSDRQQYLKNAYRVLLTRARQGMAIFVPAGDPRDHTRKAEYYDDTFAYLAELGLTVI